MTIEQLYCLVKIAETQSFSLAAQELYMSQQNLSSIVARLEEAFNCKIFKRSPRQITLTEQGQLLLPKIEALLSQYEDCLSTFCQERTTIRLIVSSPLTVENFCSFYDEVSKYNLRLSVVEDNSPQRIIEKIINKEARFGLVMLYHPLETEWDKALQVVKFYDAPLNFIVPSDHPLAKRMSIPFQECLHYPLILDNDQIVRDNILQYNLKRLNLSEPYTIVAEVNLLSNIIEMVRRGHGFGFAAITADADQLAQWGLTYIPIADVPHAQASLIYHKDTLLSADDRLLLKYLKKYFAK